MAFLSPSVVSWRCRIPFPRSDKMGNHLATWPNLNFPNPINVLGRSLKFTPKRDASRANLMSQPVPMATPRRSRRYRR